MPAECVEPDELELHACDQVHCRQIERGVFLQRERDTVTDFFDTLGIGSFATTTSLWRARRTVPDEHIPGTLNVVKSLGAFDPKECMQGVK